jgi:hypothetical protein
MTKKASARAYMAGFCKAAEICGINPRMLVKLAMRVMPSQVAKFFKVITGENPLARLATVDPVVSAAERFVSGTVGRAANRVLRQGLSTPKYMQPVLTQAQMDQAVTRGLSGLRRAPTIKPLLGDVQRYMNESNIFQNASVEDFLRAIPGINSRVPVFTGVA